MRNGSAGNLLSSRDCKLDEALALSSLIIHPFQHNPLNIMLIYLKPFIYYITSPLQTINLLSKTRLPHHS